MAAAVLQPADWGDHHTWHWRGHACHWRVIGPEDGQPILLLHGFGAASGHWRRTAPELAELGWRVFSLDLLGFGDSDQPAQRIDNRLWALQATAFLHDVVQQQTVVVGHSLGGLTALTAGVLEPDMVRAVVAAPLPDPAFVQPLPKRVPPWQRRWRRRLLKLVLNLLPLELLIPVISRTPLLRLALQGAYSSDISGDAELIRLIAQPARRSTAARALRGMSLGMGLRPRGATAPALLEQRQKPMMLIWGRQDRFIPLSIGRGIRDRYAGVELAVIENCGHCPHDEVPDRFLAVLMPWLDRNLGCSRPVGDDQRR